MTISLGRPDCGSNWSPTILKPRIPGLSRRAIIFERRLGAVAAGISLSAAVNASARRSHCWQLHQPLAVGQMALVGILCAASCLARFSMVGGIQRGIHQGMDVVAVLAVLQFRVCGQPRPVALDAQRGDGVAMGHPVGLEGVLLVDHVVPAGAVTADAVGQPSLCYR